MEKRIKKAEMQTLLDVQTITRCQHFNLPFSTSRVQRHLKVGYNRACHIIEKGLSLGVFTQEERDKGSFDNVKKEKEYKVTDCAEFKSLAADLNLEVSLWE